MTAVGYAQERSDVVVCAPVENEYQRAVQAAELAAPCRPHNIILVVPKAVGDHWRKSGVKCRVMDRFGRGREIFVPQPPLQTEVQHSSEIARSMETTRAGRVQTLSKKAREAGFVFHAHLAAAAGAESGERGKRGGTSKKQLAEEAIAIEATALEPATKKKYDAALRKIEKSNPHLLPMTSPLDVKMGFAHLKGLKGGEIGTLRKAVRWWHHEQRHGAPPLEHESLRYFWIGLKKLANNKVKEKERLSK
uniref:Uncharacterized protein n=1 Tax=Chromera velia CCMP2878 TaxID=1169474 RepID=A0A0K6S7J1_9ALVE|eukprot:Cvel_20792.t1-p1 / transcript=Cvel_20792.t1 / gene=Cvel_20792 / organism=Chromera_velia_CCMP2878 / gene_product=hypothetical protein / transcript_product=hypothetical protein / location=Cvel_scaffold1898:30284-31420(+) / protein_length=248 / sequence_SO=supercontig / SO=protein_coding / is_pseudo=false